jgi:hypothetical protein
MEFSFVFHFTLTVIRSASDDLGVVWTADKPVRDGLLGWPFS